MPAVRSLMIEKKFAQKPISGYNKCKDRIINGNDLRQEQIVNRSDTARFKREGADMNVAEIVRQRISQYEEAEPILFKELTYDLNQNKAAAYVAINRMMHENVIKQFEKGIYYKPKRTRFGTLSLNKDKLIRKKYFQERNGYITGPVLWNQWGLTSQLPNRQWIALEIRQKRLDSSLNVLLLKAKTTVTAENSLALQFLDVLDQIELIPDTRVEASLAKLIEIFRNRLSTVDKRLTLKLAVFYRRSVQVLLGLIAETTVNDGELLVQLKNYQELVSKGKKVILAVDPIIFDGNRSWGNGYATASKSSGTSRNGCSGKRGGA